MGRYLKHTTFYPTKRVHIVGLCQWLEVKKVDKSLKRSAFECQKGSPLFSHTVTYLFGHQCSCMDLWTLISIDPHTYVSDLGPMDSQQDGPSHLCQCSNSYFWLHRYVLITRESVVSVLLLKKIIKCSNMETIMMPTYTYSYMSMLDTHEVGD